MSDRLDRIISGNELKQGVSFIDADTLVENGESLRLQGFDAPEIAKWASDGRQYDDATAGGWQANKRIQDLAKSQGFTNIVRTGQIDPNGRPIVELQNERGENFTTRLLQSGALRSNRYTSQEDLDAMKVAEVFRNQASQGEETWYEAGEDIAAAIQAEAGDNLEFKRRAINELEFAAFPQYVTSDVLFRKSDRDIRNNANNPFSEAWDSGLKGVEEAAYGFLNLLGEETGLEELADIGDAGVARAQARIGESAAFITDYKEVEDFDSAIEFLGTNLAMSIPYMGITIAGAAAAPLTGGLSLAAPASVYTGQVWNEQEGDNKDAVLAIGTGVAQATLDRIGLGFLTKSAAGVGPKELLKQAVNHQVKNGVPKAQAEAIVNAASRKEIAGLVGEAGKVAKDQLAKKKVAMQLLSRAGTGVAGEGVTEAMQETLAYLGANKDQLSGDAPFDWDALQERAIAAAIAGGALGGAFGTAGGVIDTGQWADVAFRQAPADAKHLSQAGRYAELEKAERGHVPTIQELTAENRAAPESAIPVDTRIADAKKSRKERDLRGVLTDTIASAPRLWRGATRAIFTPQLQQQSRAARVLADMFGGNLQRTFSGSNFENFKHHKVSIYKNMIEMPDKFWQVMGGGRRVNAEVKRDISKKLYKTLQTSVDKDGKFDPKAVPQDTPNRDYVIKVGKELQVLGDKLWEDQRKYNPELGYIPNYLARYKSFNKQSIADDKIGFTTALVDKFGMSHADANRIFEGITTSPEINNIDEAFSVLEGGHKPGSHKKRTLDLAEQAEFQKYMEQDIFSNISTAAKAATRYQAYEQFVGKDGKELAKLYDQMEREGVPPEQVNEIARQMQDYLDAESGNYKRPTTEFGKSLEKVQKNFMVLTTFAGLGLSTLSSLPELALTTRGLTKSQLTGPNGLQSLGKELAETMWNGMKETSTLATGKHNVYEDSAGRSIIRDHGYLEWEVGAATTTGVTETNILKQKYLEAFFKWNGLQGYTNMTRAIRASFAGDFMFNHFDTIRQYEKRGGQKTNEVQEAEEALRTLGLDPHRLIEAMDSPVPTPEQQAFIEDQMREGTFNFINEAIALPQAQNRPLIFQDPRFALFTQFQGFISTITANHIPKLWGEYVKRGSPAMKYNAFALMVMMIALGFASQHLKDLLKYGKESPYLDDAEYIRRGVFSSGLLGTGERVIDTLFPIYDQQSKGAGEWVWNETTGQSPALSNLTTAGAAAGDVITGDVGSGIKKGARLVPFLAPLSGVRQAIGESVSDWNFKGE